MGGNYLSERHRMSCSFCLGGWGGLCKLKKLESDLDFGVEIEWEFGEFDQSFTDDWTKTIESV
jgi:hypothetical protein